MKTILIITGPQGSGNHLFSKIFATHPKVNGWTALLERYWIGHDEEPFAEYWRTPSSILSRTWEDGFYVTSISNPYIDDGVESTPRYDEVVRNFTVAGFKVILGVIGRDSNIVRHQQQRVRGKETLHKFLETLPEITGCNPIFMSTELLYMYRAEYVRSLFLSVSLPCMVDESKIENILSQDPNTKYLSYIQKQPLDNSIHFASKPRKDRV